MPRDLALEILNNFNKTGIFPAHFLEAGFRKNRALSGRDRALVVQLVQGVLRWRKRLDWILSQKVHFPFRKIDSFILNVLRLALYQIFFMDRIPESAAVNEAVKQAKRLGKPHLAGFVNGVLRETLRSKDKIFYPHKDGNIIRYYSILYSYPEWMVEKWISELGENFAIELMEAGNKIPLLNLRANRLKANRDELIKALEAEGVKGEATLYSPWGVKVKGLKRPVFELESHKKGLFHVQGESAQIVSAILDVKPGDFVLDVCAGLGGKTTHLGELSGSEARIVACDIQYDDLIKLRASAERLGLSNIYPVVADATGQINNLLKIKFQKILVDAPCSGLGVISRHPDIKWARKKSDIERLSSLQEQILTMALNLLDEGGKILYATCTISSEENEKVVEKFLMANSGIRLENIGEVIPGWGKELVDENGFYRTYPNVHSMEGFFGALMIKGKCNQ